LRAKQSQAKSVEAQIAALDVQFGKVVDAWDGARVALAASEKELAANRIALRRARRLKTVADRRVARRLVAIYEGDQPDLVSLLVGASSLSDALNVVEYSRELAGADRRIADEAHRARDRLARAQRSLQEVERSRRATVSTLASERSRISSMLAERSRLLASVKSEITALKAREAAEQARLAAAARARLARQEALLRAQAAARARAAAAARAKAAAAARNATPDAGAATPAPTTSVAPTTTNTTTVPVTTDAPPTVALPTPPATGVPLPPAATDPGAGHPEAASIALRYLGVPYQWGGASPVTGFDCSGLVMYVYAQLGVQLPHYAAAQFGYGTPVGRDQLQPGDLVFFDGLSHVGIYIGNGEFVHAPQTGDVVKISPLSAFAAGYVGARRL